MAKYSKFNIVYQLQKWMDSVAGQTFMNYAYSWGAAVVILGTLFKLTHLPGANIMLFIGMGTEVFVFFISAFDRPFDKTAEGRDLATDTELAAALANSMANTGGQVGAQNIAQPNSQSSDNAIAAGDNATASAGGNGGSGATIVVGGGYIPVGGTVAAGAATAPETTLDGDGGTIIMGQSVVPGTSGSPISFEGTAPAEGVSTGSGIAIGAPAPAVSPETAVAMEEATTTYVDRLNELNELLLKVGAQSERLTTDSEEMENLNRTLTGIARVYEMQLKSASQQITTQDEINEQTRKMAKQIQELNAIYTRMIEAMTVNMAANSVGR